MYVLCSDNTQAFVFQINTPYITSLADSCADFLVKVNKLVFVNLRYLGIPKIDKQSQG